MSLTQSAFSEEPRVAAPNEPHLACVLLLDTSGSMSGTPLDQLDLKIKVKRLRSSYEEEVDAGEVAGYDPTVLGAQKLTVTAHGKTCSVKVNVVAVDLATPVVRAENGKLHVEYDKAHTERLVLTINGKEYSYADATEDGYLRESITGDSFTVTAQATSSLSGINDSTVSEPVTLRRTAPSSEGSQESCRCLETRAWRTSRTALW